MNRIGITTKIIVAVALATTAAALLPATEGADWQDGAIMVTVGRAGVNDCDDDYLCFWEDKNYTTAVGTTTTTARERAAAPAPARVTPTWVPA